MKKLLALLTMCCLLACTVMAVGAVSEASVWGDLSGDDVVGTRDLLMLRQHIAGISALEAPASGDLNYDDAVNMKDVLTLRLFVAGLIDVPTTTKPTTTKPTMPTATGSSNDVYRYDENGEPIMTFLDGVDDCSLGVWWWQTDDGQNETRRENYLNFLEKNGTTEIYYYCVYDMVNSYGRQTTYDFVLAAREHGMSVVPLYDDVGMINGVERCDVPVSKMISMFKAYNDSYPDAPLSMIHFDVEPHQVFDDQNIKHLTEKELSLYANNFIGGIQALREEGIKVEAALNCTWNNYGGENVEWNGVKGIYNICAKGLDSMCMMAYRDTAADILALGQPGFDAAMEYGTRISYGIETGVYPQFNQPYEEFGQESKEYMYTEFAKVFESLRANHPAGGYGLAVHYHRTWMTMKNEADFT